MKYLKLFPLKSALSLLFLGILTTSLWGDPAPTLRVGIMGDHRGDNKAWDTNTWDRYTDDGITKAALKDIAEALAAEDVDLVLNVGDLVTKWTKQLKNTTPDALMAKELADWASIWKTHSGNLPIFPVRGNQEVSASSKVWQDFVKGLPGIGWLTPNGPVGEEYATYSFKIENCLFVGIDQYMPPANNDTHPISVAAMEFLANQLDPKVNRLTRSGHKFVWGHTPAFPIWDMKAAPFTAIKDGIPSPYASFTFDLDGINYMQMRETFWEILGQRKAQYFCGHDHIFARGLASDIKGRWVPQITIGNGGAPPPVLPPKPVPADYIYGPYAEAYTGIAFPVVPTNLVYQLDTPRIVTESFPLFDIPTDPPPPKVTGLPYGWGYVVLEITGPTVTAVYKAEPAAGAGFVEMDRWVIQSE